MKREKNYSALVVKVLPNINKSNNCMPNPVAECSNVETVGFICPHSMTGFG